MRLHGTERWRKRAKLQLKLEPLCRLCAAEGRTTPAEVADHVVAHRGDVNAFWLGEIQSLCKSHHDGLKQRIEKRGYDPSIGASGLPTDKAHPWYAGSRWPR